MRARCRDCAHFQADGAAMEAAFPGLSALSSGYASVRGGDGLCGLHGLYLPGGDHCRSFAHTLDPAGNKGRQAERR